MQRNLVEVYPGFLSPTEASKHILGICEQGHGCVILGMSEPCVNQLQNIGSTSDPTLIPLGWQGARQEAQRRHSGVLS